MNSPESTITLTIEDIAFGGKGIARFNGMVVFIPFVDIGEKVRARITRKKRKYWEAECLEVLTPSDQRTTPECPYFQDCGGCQFQHISYNAELAHKQKQVDQVISRIGKLPDSNITPIIHSPHPYHYRNRISVHCDKGKIGFHAHRSGKIIDIEKCLLASTEVNQRLSKLRNSNPKRPHYSIRSQKAKGTHFVQSNELLAPQLISLVTQELLPDIHTLIEGYAGAGFFTEAFIPKVQELIIIENSPTAIAEAQNKLPHSTTILEGLFEELLSEVVSGLTNSKVNACFIDPPREGLHHLALKTLLHSASQPLSQLIYLSCNPSTLARDLNTLSEKWELLKITPIDLFPRTSHIECLAVLQPK